MTRFMKLGAFVVVGAAMVGCHASADVGGSSTGSSMGTSTKEVHTKEVRDANGNLISKESSNATVNP